MNINPEDLEGTARMIGEHMSQLQPPEPDEPERAKPDLTNLEVPEKKVPDLFIPYSRVNDPLELKAALNNRYANIITTDVRPIMGSYERRAFFEKFIKRYGFPPPPGNDVYLQRLNHCGVRQVSYFYFYHDHPNKASAPHDFLGYEYPDMLEYLPRIEGVYEWRRKQASTRGVRGWDLFNRECWDNKGEHEVVNSTVNSAKWRALSQSEQNVYHNKASRIREERTKVILSNTVIALHETRAKKIRNQKKRKKREASIDEGWMPKIPSAAILYVNSVRTKSDAGESTEDQPSWKNLGPKERQKWHDLYQAKCRERAEICAAVESQKRKRQKDAAVPVDRGEFDDDGAF